MKPYTEGLTEEKPIEIKESLLGVGLRILKKYPGSYSENLRHWVYTEDEVQIILISNIPIKDIKIKRGIPDYLKVATNQDQKRDGKTE